MIDNNRQQLIDNIRIAIASANDRAEVLQAAVELIDNFSESYSWTGFYMKNKNKLEVGPYIGEETPHKVIELGSGICGASAVQKESIVVDDVNADPRFLACSLKTRSEIVVPLMDGDTVLGEIDIDSDIPANFNQHDKDMLEAVAAVIVERLKQL